MNFPHAALPSAAGVRLHQAAQRRQEDDSEPAENHAEQVLPDAAQQPADTDPPGITVVGLPAAGIAELGRSAQSALAQADIIFGSWRQLNLLGDATTAERQPWPSPLVPAMRELLLEQRGRNIVVLASGDPFFHGIGSTLLRLVPELSLQVIPAPSSVSLACARLGWAVQDTPVVSLVTGTVAGIGRMLDVASQFFILARDEASLSEVAEYLCQHNASTAAVGVLQDLGSADEVITWGSAQHPPAVSSALYIIAVICDPAQQYRYSIAPGLPDTAFAHDGQLTKQKIRALTVIALAPRPGEVLWDVGGGSGSIAIEWLRLVPTTRAVTFERDEVRCQRISDNAHRLGVAERLAILHAAPQAYFEVPDAPDAIFIGGGLTAPDVFDEAYNRLKPGGRLVANAVTVESQHRLWELRNAFGGSITQIQLSTEHAVGSFHALQAALPLWQWEVRKPALEA